MIKLLSRKPTALRLVNPSAAKIKDRKSGSAGMPRPISYAVFCLKKKKEQNAYGCEALDDPQRPHDLDRDCNHGKVGARAHELGSNAGRSTVQRHTSHLLLALPSYAVSMSTVLASHASRPTVSSPVPVCVMMLHRLAVYNRFSVDVACSHQLLVRGLFAFRFFFFF